MMRSGSLLLGLLLSLVLPALAEAQESACAQCHMEALSQPTDMGHAAEPVEQCRVLIDHPLLTATFGKYSYRIERKGNQSLYSVTDGSASITLPIRWAFGASSAMGQTYILDKDGTFYESRMSWFRELNALGPTLGGGNSLPANLEEAAGRVMSPDDKRGCFGCHTTDSVHGTEFTLEKMIPGVRCEHCHEGAEAHLAAATGKSDKPYRPPDLRNFSAEQAANFCGRCHRTWAEIAIQAKPSIANVRFQPYRLTESKCYDPDDPRISCLACHNPHAQVDRRPVDYDAKCQACHGGGKAGAKACPVSKIGCTTCHMPKINLPGAHYKFSDHRIRIMKPNEPFPG